ncbi:MAG TPA: hypothetical protein VJP85_07320 [Candidatus Baltobacteraceae bacterium]|nr:hypothetical protein [Candidatus Baltobacteraceae bacterium]
MLTRRKLLLGGLAAAGALAAGDVLYEFSSDDDRVIIAAIAPVMIGLDVPARDVVRGFDVAAAGLPREVQGEVHQLLGLLRFPVTRALVAGIWHPWHSANREEVAAFLQRWRYSEVTKLRAAYDALHQLVLAAWYGNDAAWTAIGYAGPPSVG